MADEVYFGTREAPSPKAVQLFASGNAPSAWELVDALPLGALPSSASKRVAIVVTGVVCQVRTSGATPARGVLEVCLGLTSGARSTFHRATMSLAYERLHTQPLDGVPFTFVMVQQSAGGGRPAIVDPTFGATTNTAAAEFAVYARCDWNGDVPAYGIDPTLPPTIRNVSWFWADMDELEANGHVMADRSTSFSAAGWTGTNQIGATSETWVAFQSLYQKPLSAGSFLRTAAMGIDKGGALEVQTSVRTIRSHPGGTPTPTESAVRHCWGGFQRVEVDATAHYPRLTLEAPLSADVFTCLAIRVDQNLAPQGGSYTADVGDVTELYDALPWTPYHAHEVSAPSNPVAVVQVSGVTFRVDDAAEYGLRNHPVLAGDPQSYPKAFVRVLGSVSEPSRELIPSIVIRPVILGFEQVDTSQAHYVNRWFTVSPPQRPTRTIEASLAAFNTVHDQSSSASKWVEPAPLELAMDPEGPLVGTLSAPPTPPNAAISTRVEGHRVGRVASPQGYSRTWPNWVRPRRVFSLSWGPLSASAGAAVVSFLQANRTFALTPPHGIADVAVTQRGPFQSSVLPDGRVEVTAEVTELIFTA